MYLGTSTLGHIIYVGLAVGCLGAGFVTLLNMWIRGETFHLGGIDRIERFGPVHDEDLIEGELQAAAARSEMTLQQAAAARVRKWVPWRSGVDSQPPTRRECQYARNYLPGQKGKRALAQLGATDWEQAHMEWEAANGMVDMSDMCFEEEPEHDVGIVAQFLNSSLLAAFGKGRAAPAAGPPADPSLTPCRVEVPGGQGGKRLLRDALLQWRLRHTAHPLEAQAGATACPDHPPIPNPDPS